MAVAGASNVDPTTQKGDGMNDSPQPPRGQPDLHAKAELIEAASRLILCTGQASEDENWPVFSVLAARFALLGGCSRMLANHREGIGEAPDPELLADLATAGVASHASARELLDHYVSVQLEGAAAALGMLQDFYAKDARGMSQRIGNALFAARHWVEAARGGIDGWVVAHARKGIC